MESSKLTKSQTKYYNTACLMDEALIGLLEKKSYEFISIKELCGKAGVNRSTFYLHYETMDDLLSECIEYIGNKIKLKYTDEAFINKNKLSKCPIEELLLVTPKYLIPYLEFVKENKAVFRAAASQPGVFRTQSVSGYLFKEWFQPILDRFGVPKEEQEYRVAFFLSGMWAIIMKWVMGDCKEETGYISKLIVDCIGVNYSSVLTRLLK